MSEKYLGYGKVVEECGELCQVIGKLVAFPDGTHPDGEERLEGRLEKEIADLYAALDYFVRVNRLDEFEIKQRREMKLEKFLKWGLTGISNE